MEKYAVVTGKDRDGEKTASVGPSTRYCPTCGVPLVKGANVPKCPKCGTKPFERKPDGSKKEA
jgi:hypothetical protein